MARPLGYDLRAVKSIDTFRSPEVQMRTLSLGVVAVVVSYLLADPLFILWFLIYEACFGTYVFVLTRAPRRVRLGYFLAISALGVISMLCLLSVCLYLYIQPLSQFHYGGFILYFAVAMNTVALRLREPYFYLIDIAALYITAFGFIAIEFWRSGLSIPSLLIGFGIVMFCIYHGYLVYEMDRVRRGRDAAQDRQIWSEHQRAVGQISGGVAHDFNNLLTVVLGNLEMSREMRNDADRDQLLAEAEAAVRRGAQLTGQLLAFSRKANLSPAAINLQDLKDQLEPLARGALGRRHRLKMSDVSGLPPLYADSATLTAVLLNLILNAQDAMLNGGTIWIDAEVAPHGGTDMMCLRINDTGRGIALHHQEKVFEPFFSTKPTGQGSGLGLPMALGFAEQSCGDIELSSTPDEGTEVTLWMPLADVQGDGAAMPKEQASTL